MDQLERNKDIVRRFVEEFLNKRNAAAVDEMAAADFVDHQGGLGPTGDRESLKQFVGAITAGFSDMHFEIQQLVAEDDRVLLHIVGSGTHTGEFQGVAATGKSVTFAGMSVTRLVDGKLVERWNVVDLAGLMRQIA